MTTFRQISGQLVKSYTTNPDNPLEGQMWYNQTELKLKGVVASGAWISTSPLNTARDAAGGAGIQTAAMVFGGRNEIDGPPTGGPNQKYNLNEEYNGTGYSTGGALVQGRQGLSGAGTQTAGLGVGGYHPPAPGVKSLVEEYDGSTWSEVNDIPTATFAMGSAGTQTAAVVTGGRTPSWVASTYEYDGTTWTGGGALGTARTLRGAMTGTLTAALAVGGDLNPPGGATNKVEEYNGTAWTEVNSYPTNINVNMVSGIQTSALSFGGAPYTTNAFTYDGTNFTATASMGSPVSGQNTLKTATNNSTGLSMGGYGTSSYIATSEEYNFSTQVITPAAWSSGGNLPGGRADHAMIGDKTGVVMFGSAAPLNETLIYDGSSWTSGNNTNTSARVRAGIGTTSAGLGFGGYAPGSTAFVGNTEEYNGTNWSEQNDLSTARGRLGGAGTQTAGLAFGGAVPPNGSAQNATEEYDGSSWTAGGNLGTARYNATSAGTQTAAAFVGGYVNFPSATQYANVENYDGTSWTSGTAVPEARTNGNRYGGTNSDDIVIFSGGSASTPTADFTNTSFWNGTSWFTGANVASLQSRFGGTASTSGTGIGAGGSPTSPPSPTATEEYNGETTATNIVDITTS